MAKKCSDSLILKTLKEKSTTKLKIYNNTLKVFNELKQVANEFAKETKLETAKINKDIVIGFHDEGEFEAKLQVAGDMLLFLMHTNIFEFPKDHNIMKSSYMKKDKLLSYCGIIYVYNFLADSFKYNRTNDAGYLVARIFINKESHFIVEGKRQFEFLNNTFASGVINKKILRKILETAVLYCLEFDLLLPPYDTMQEINFGEMQEYSTTLNIKTGKRLGFRFQTDPDETL
jgi:hypothetical protein